MIWFLLGVALLVLVLLAGRAFLKADPADVARFVRRFSVMLPMGLGLVAIVALIAADLFIPLIGILILAAPFVLKHKDGIRRWFRGTGAGRVSEVETVWIRMTLDQASGVMTGQVRRGPLAGARLSELTHPEMRQLLRDCRSDPASASLLESYLDRIMPGWRDEEAAEQSPPPGGKAGMSRDEAFEVLGLKPGASEDQIKEAHRRLMRAVHPDHGGSTVLAAQINRAKDVLLG